LLNDENLITIEFMSKLSCSTHDETSSQQPIPTLVVQKPVVNINAHKPNVKQQSTHLKHHLNSHSLTKSKNLIK
jgi:hypothetical protein